MADPLSMIASIGGLVAFAAGTARSLNTLISDFKEAPDEILHVQRDTQALIVVLKSLTDACSRANLQTEDQALVETLVEYINMCQATMLSMKSLLQSFTTRGVGRRNPWRIIGWTMRKGEIKALRDRLLEGKASLTLTVSALNGVIEGKGQEAIKAELNKLYEKLNTDFRNLETGRRVRRRVEDDVSSMRSSKRRRRSLSDFTDAGVPLQRYFDQLPAYDSTELPPAEGDILWAKPTGSLIEAVRSSDSTLVTQLISHGVSTEERSPDGFTALHFCAIYNNSDMARVLLEHGADINTKDNQLRSPLQVALASESVKVAAFLIEKGCAIGDTVPTIASLVRREDEVPGAIELVRNLAPRSNKLSRPPFLLHQAIEDDDTRFVQLLCDAGWDANAEESHGLPPLYVALLFERHTAVQTLLKNGADTNHLLAGLRHAQTEQLVEWAKELKDCIGEFGITPLHLAAGRDPGLVRLLLEAGANPNFVYSGDGGILLMGICAGIYLESAKLLIEYGANVNHQSRPGYSPLYWATRCGNEALVRLLLKRGANVNIVDNEGYTPLHMAVLDDEIEVARILVGAGADWSRKDNNGVTAADLISICKRGDEWRNI